ncbi:hypothetical protein VPH35_051612 [Triticum aestivum]
MDGRVFVANPFRPLAALVLWNVQKGQNPSRQASSSSPRPLRLVSSMPPPLPRRHPRARTPSASSPPRSLLSNAAPLTHRQGRRQHVGDTPQWSSDKSRAADWIEGTR